MMKSKICEVDEIRTIVIIWENNPSYGVAVKQIRFKNAADEMLLECGKEKEDYQETRFDLAEGEYLQGVKTSANHDEPTWHYDMQLVIGNK